jgi:hypothetical protein
VTGAVVVSQTFVRGLYTLFNEAVLKGRNLLCLLFRDTTLSTAVLYTFYLKNT